jgi:GT2 family glycosyltransferase
MAESLEVVDPTQQSQFNSPWTSPPFVVAIVPTYKRKAELARLLALIAETPEVRCTVVVDNAADLEVRELFERAQLPGAYLAMETNRGPAAAINQAIKFARETWGESITHYWMFDDDIRFTPDILQKMLAALVDNKAQLVAPIITSAAGAVFAWPELKSRTARRLFSSRDRNDPARFGEGIDPHNLPEIRACMATCYLMERVCYDRVGGPREDFWLIGEDVEFTARICRKFRAVCCPHVAIEHFWGSPLDPRSDKRSTYLKGCAALQNNLFLLLHVLRTRYILRSFLGSLKRFFHLHLRSREAAYDLLWILWNASVRGQPAGARSGQVLRERRRDYEPP